MAKKEYTVASMEVCELEPMDIVTVSSISGSTKSRAIAQTRLDTNGDDNTLGINGGGGQWDTGYGS